MPTITVYTPAGETKQITYDPTKITTIKQLKTIIITQMKLGTQPQNLELCIRGEEDVLADNRPLAELGAGLGAVTLFALTRLPSPYTTPEAQEFF